MLSEGGFMKIAILIYDGFTALDAVGPYEVLSCLPGAKVHLVSTERGPKRAHTNFLSLMADYTLNDISDPEIILVSGGTKGTMVAAEDPRILSWLRKAHETSKWTTSVCTGSLILGAAGILKGLQATTHWYARELLEKFGAQYLSERVVSARKNHHRGWRFLGHRYGSSACEGGLRTGDGEGHSIVYGIRSTTAFRFWIHRKSRAFDCCISEARSAGCVQ